jgi:hypothetical protein
MGVRTRRRARTALAAVALAAFGAAGCWPQPGADAGNTNRAPGATLSAADVTALAPVWSRPGWLSAVVGGQVVTRGVSSASTTVTAYDAGSGATRWSRVLGPADAGVRQAMTDPIVAGNRVWASWIAAGTGSGGTGCAAAVERLDLHTGASLGAPTAGFASALVSFAGQVAVAGGSLVADPGVPGGCRPSTTGVRVDDEAGGPSWAAAAGAGGSQRPIVVDGVLVTRDGGRLSGYRAAGCGAPTCTPIWTTTVGTGGVQQLAAEPGGPIVAIGDGPSGEPYRLVTLDPATGAVLSSTPEEFSLQSFAVGDGVAYLNVGGSVEAYDVDGCAGGPCPRLWSADAPEAFVGNPVVAGDLLLLAGTEGSLLAYDVDGCGAATCAPVAQVTVIPDPSTGTPAVVIADGDRVYVQNGGNVLALAPGARP